MAAEDLGGDVLAMLEVRASDAMPTWLARRLASAWPGARPRVLRVYPGGASRSKEAAAFEAHCVADPEHPEAASPVSVDATLAATIRDRPALASAEAGGRCRLLAPLAAGNEVRYVVELEADRPAPRDDATGRLLAIANAYFERLVEAETDPLTRLANRRVFHAHMEHDLRRWACSRREYFLAVLDVDHFKRINDRFGHLYGDEILVHFAGLMRKSFRAGDLLYRFGGEEFVLVYGVDKPGGGEATLRRFRAAVEAFHFPGVGRITVSIGYTRIGDTATPTALLVERADQALYYAKTHGRNQVACWEALVESGAIAPKAPWKPDVTLF